MHLPLFPSPSGRNPARTACVSPGRIRPAIVSPGPDLPPTPSSRAPRQRPAPFLRALTLAALAAALPLLRAQDVEQPDLKFGFIKLTDCAPLVVAKELGYFEDEGLYVTLEAQANWKILLDRVITGELDGAHMLAGQPLAATIGFGTKAHVITAFSMDLNGNGITLANDIWERMQAASPELAARPAPFPLAAGYLKPIVDELRHAGTPMKMGMVFPVSTHNYELRYWLAAGGIRPGFYTASDTTGTTDADVLISVTPPPSVRA